jgi:hypothetical protein
MKNSISRAEFLKLSFGSLLSLFLMRCGGGGGGGLIFPEGTGSSLFHLDMNVHPGFASIDELLGYVRNMRVRSIRVTALADNLANLHTVSLMASRAPSYGIETFLAILTTSGPVPIHDWMNMVRRTTSIISGATHWQILNEPVYQKGLSEVEYIQNFLKPAYIYIKGLGKTVVSASEIGNGFGPSRIRIMIDSGLMDYTDIIAIHSFEASPLDYSFLSSYGKPVWITETGFNDPNKHIEHYRNISSQARSANISKIFWYTLAEDSGFGIFFF